MKITKHDKKLVRILKQNPRIQFKELGKKLNMSDVAARKRFLSLLKKGTLQIDLVTNISSSNIVFGRLDIVAKDLDSNNLLLRRAQLCPRIRLASATTGEHTFSATFAAEGINVLQYCIEHFRTWNQELIIKSQFILFTQVSKPAYLPIPISETEESKSQPTSEVLRILSQETPLEPCGVNCTHCTEFRINCSGCPSRADWEGIA